MKFAQSLKSVFLWKDRQRVFHQISDVPIPLLFSFTQRNRPDDMDLLRLISPEMYILPPVFVRSALAFGSKHHGKKSYSPRSPPLNPYLNHLNNGICIGVILLRGTHE